MEQTATVGYSAKGITTFSLWTLQFLLGDDEYLGNMQFFHCHGHGPKPEA